MTGRARGRGRSRGRAGPPSQGEARRPGSAAEAQPQVGRGRSRGPPPGSAAAVPVAAATAAAPPPATTAAPAPPTEQMAGMGLAEGGEQRGPRGRRGIMYGYEEKRIRPEHVQIKTGSTGNKITISTNHFKLKTRPQFAVYQYNVAYSPEVDSKSARHGMLMEHRELTGSTMAFDGMILYLPKKLPDQVTKLISKRRSDDSDVELTITLTNELPPDSPICVQLFNVVFRRVLKHIDMTAVGRNYYNVNRVIELPRHKLELWPGFSTSILHYENAVLLQADVSHKVLRKETVLNHLYDIYGSRQGGPNFHENSLKKLVGEIVLTRYNNKTYRIDDIAWDARVTDTFETKDGPITYVDYYTKTYNKVIQDPDQPLLVSRPRAAMVRRGMTGDLYLVPELCFLTGLSDEMRADFNMMKDLATHTRVDPQSRCRTLQGFIADINRSPEASAELSGWGLQFDTNLLSMGGRELPGETIYQRDIRYNYDTKVADWGKEMRGAKLKSTVNLEDWIILHTTRDAGIAKDFTSTLRKVCGPMGILVREPRRNGFALNDDRTETYLRTIREEMKSPPQMVVCILPTNRKDRYDSIKKVCCLESPVPSQVIVSRTLSKKQMLMSVATKIGIQLNVKLGGEVWALEIPLKDLMVVGYDTYHDSVRKGQSVGGFVASLNPTLTRYHSRCTFQHTGMELADGLKVCMTGALRRYAKENGKLPERIIFYRDGVGDGQLNAVVEHEVAQLLQCFKDVLPSGEEYKPKFAVIVVKKRVSARLFALDQRSGHPSNPRPGSVIDTEVTRSEWYDFFLISQSVRQGTVTPTHYNIVYDTSGLKPDHFQRLTYKLTHLYYNWPGTIRVPAPCQYAHKLAFLVGQSLHQAPKPELADKLFYL